MLFSIVTRTMPGRQALLARCVDSVRAQTLGDVEHIILRDEVGVGVAAAQRMLWTVTPKGDYVLVLDDDDYLSAPDVLMQVGVRLLSRPKFAVVKVCHGQFGVMPLEWGQVPAIARITVSNVIVANAVWVLHRQQFGLRYAGDFDFIASLFDAYNPQWIDVAVVTVERGRAGQL